MKTFNKVLMNIYHLMAKRMVWKIALWGWFLILLTITIFLFFMIPFQKNIALERMENEASDIASTFLVANSSLLITENYSLVVDHSQELVKVSNSILYMVITKKDGYSMIYTKDGWKQENLSGMWLPDTSDLRGKIIYNPLVNKEVFHKPVRFSYLGIYWGIIHIGLSLDKYNSSVRDITISMTWLTVIIAMLGFLVSILLAKRFTKPIMILDKTTKLITEGDLNAHADIKTGDELESLASSFNMMTNSLRIERENLEAKVKERTSQLEDTNVILTREVNERKKAEDSLQKYTFELQNSLKEKEVLLKEIHHRVKNNLQIITSLLSLQSMRINDETNLAIFKDSQNRIKSMALVHEKLYQSKELSKINFGEYVINLSNYIRESYSNQQVKIDLKFEIDELFLPIDTVVPLGLIINELISNSFKYAFNHTKFNHDRVNCISIKSKSFEANTIIEFEDNGIGIPKDLNIEESQSLGLKLVYNLCMQIGGELKIESNNGTKFTIMFTK